MLYAIVALPFGQWRSFSAALASFSLTLLEFATPSYLCIFMPDDYC
jgi:hypothetical protein